MNKEKLKIGKETQRGITLIALIITIIVLLILAIVTIREIQGEGIIAHAKNAVTKYGEGAAEENETLKGYAEMIQEQTGGASGGSSSIASTTADGVPIPKGFKYIEGTKEEGVVIEREDEDKSQFVWVPVTTEITSKNLGPTNYREPDVITGNGSSATDMASGNEFDAVKANLDEAGCTQDLTGDNVVNAYDFKKQLETEFNAMAESVKTYGGFYVGRYETSFNSSGKAQSISGVESAYSTDGSSNRPGFWYTLYGKQREYSTDSVQGSMIWGSQYDAMMTWMGAAANTTIEERNTERTTGTATDDVIKKVYDLYGNSREWTLEAFFICFRVGRGGNYSKSYSPSSRGNDYRPGNNGGNIGSRLSLYIR